MPADARPVVGAYSPGVHGRRTARVHRLRCEVTFRALATAEIRRYWQSGEPADKAGGYAVQGRAALFIERIAGSYSGIMGLPLFETGELLAAIGAHG